MIGVSEDYALRLAHGAGGVNEAGSIPRPRLQGLGFERLDERGTAPAQFALDASLPAIRPCPRHVGAVHGQHKLQSRQPAPDVEDLAQLDIRSHDDAFGF